MGGQWALGSFYPCEVNLSGGHQMSRAVEHVVDPASDPKIPVLVTLGTISRHVVAGEAREVGFLEPRISGVDTFQNLCFASPILIAIDGAHNPRPRPRKHNVAFTLPFHL